MLYRISHLVNWVFRVFTQIQCNTRCVIILTTPYGGGNLNILSMCMFSCVQIYKYKIIKEETFPNGFATPLQLTKIQLIPLTRMLDNILDGLTENLPSIGGSQYYRAFDVTFGFCQCKN